MPIFLTRHGPLARRITIIIISIIITYYYLFINIINISPPIFRARDNTMSGWPCDPVSRTLVLRVCVFVVCFSVFPCVVYCVAGVSRTQG